MRTGPPEAGTGEGGTPTPKQGSQLGLAVVRGRGRGDGPQASRREPQTSSQRPASCCHWSSHPSCQREGSTHLGQVELVADAKRLSADLHLSFAYISTGPTDWLFESPHPSQPLSACNGPAWKKIKVRFCLTQG